MRIVGETMDGCVEYAYDCILCGDTGIVLLPYGEAGDRNIYATPCPGPAGADPCPYAAAAAKRFGWHVQQDLQSRTDTRWRLQEHQIEIGVNPMLCQPCPQVRWAVKKEKTHEMVAE